MSPTVFICFFWQDATQDVVREMVADTAMAAIAAAQRCLAAANIPEPRYRSFLSERISTWNGSERQITTVADGKIVLMSCLIETARVIPLASRLGR